MSEPLLNFIRFTDDTLIARWELRAYPVPRVWDRVEIADEMLTVSDVVWSIDPADGPETCPSLLQSVTVILR